MRDPFETLGIFEDFTPANVGEALRLAIQRGDDVTEARAAWDLLRDPEQRDAAAVLSPSMSFVARQARANVGGVVVDEAVEIVLRALAAIVEDIDSTLAAAAKRPSRADVVGDVIPLPTEYLRP